jgi:MoxR-like ATPase
MATDWTGDSTRDWNKDDPDRGEMLGQQLHKDEEGHLAKQFPVYMSLVKNAKASLGNKIFGQEKLLSDLLTAAIAGGNTRLVGLPGNGKTEALQALAQILGLKFAKIQFTADMMPSDITGSKVWIPKTEEFQFKPGPVFTQLLFADEINRASAKVQSALLEVMQSSGVTIDGKFYPVPNPFMTFAAQNPDEQAGTSPLTEAQLDRFMQDFWVGYADAPAEKRIMVETTGPRHGMLDLHRRSDAGEDLTEPFNRATALPAVLGKNHLILMQNDARHLYLPAKFVDAVIHIVRGLRPEETSSKLIRDNVVWGPGPRAYQAFALVSKARALQRGEMAPHIGDIFEIAKSVLAHRMSIKYNAQDDNGNPVTFDTLFNEVAKPFLLDRTANVPTVNQGRGGLLVPGRKPK